MTVNLLVPLLRLGPVAVLAIVALTAVAVGGGGGGGGVA